MTVDQALLVLIMSRTALCTEYSCEPQVAVDQSDRFSAAQRPRIAALDAWATQQKVTTRRGPSAAEARRDTTSFEAARRSWSSSTVSARGRVGGGGDHKSETWLG